MAPVAHYCLHARSYYFSRQQCHPAGYSSKVPLPCIILHLCNSKLRPLWFLYGLFSINYALLIVFLLEMSIV